MKGMLSVSLGPDGLHVHDCDPCVLFGDDLAGWVARFPAPAVTLEQARAGTLAGSVLRINAITRTVIYRITDEVPPAGMRGWVGRWPD